MAWLSPLEAEAGMEALVARVCRVEAEVEAEVTTREKAAVTAEAEVAAAVVEDLARTIKVNV
jgi:hypothetical protein